MLSEITSSPATRPLGGGGASISLPSSLSTSENSASGLKPTLASTSMLSSRVPAMSSTALMIWIQVVAIMPPATI